MGQLIVEYTDEQLQAIEATILNPQEWIQHAWNDKARRCMERIIEAETNLQACKLSEQEQADKIKELKPKKRTE